MLSLLILASILIIKFKPVYAVVIQGETIGYINNKKSIEEAINVYENYKEGCVAYVEFETEPTYEFTFVDNNVNISEEETLLSVIDYSTITYKLYAIKLNGVTQDYVETLEEAESVVEELVAQYEKETEVDLTIEEHYTEDRVNIISADIAKAEIKDALEVQVQEEILANCSIVSRGTNASRISREKQSLGSVTLIEPVDGIVSSRFGTWSSIRTSIHKGLDLRAPKGTDICAAERGVVVEAGTDKYYGKYIIISHTDGIETVYAHCSALYVAVGDIVKQGEVIAAVGSTGNSTGNHLHFEIRKDGVALNPQHYLYN